MGTPNSKLGKRSTEEPVVLQRTLKRIVKCDGVGLHSGEPVNLTLKPAPAGTGVVFKRTDVDDDQSIIPARWDCVVDTRLCTVIANEHGVRVGTIEHLMAALAGCGLDNVRVEINGPEVPVMDGSSGPFVFLVECAGVIKQEQPRRVIRVLKSISVGDGDAQATLEPDADFSLNVQVHFEGTAVSRQALSVGMKNGSFCKELARARTFGFLNEVEAMRAAGLGKGGSLDNAIVVDGLKILNEDGLRFEDEFVRHKMLDAVGDLFLAGGAILGKFAGKRSGHALNNALLRALFADDEAWRYDELRGDAVKTAIDGGIFADSQALASPA
ncbi:MAG: UDP-3-O-acyl-N-acetylglucosamine deacetylase [Rhodospirillales bacterium]|nr:UDP-3-O-acyl-N-acetylglucosamine deacetylase [Rhodospirillales bacterium]